jgi:hypothetical protein
MFHTRSFATPVGIYRKHRLEPALSPRFVEEAVRALRAALESQGVECRVV